MTIQDLGALGELIGSVAVLATLIYLTLQTRQNTQAIQGQLDAASMTASCNQLMMIATSSELAEEQRRDYGDLMARLTTGEVQLVYNFEATLRLCAWQLHQSRRGLLTTQGELGLTNLVRTWLTDSRSFPAFWEQQRDAYSPEFVEWVEEQRAKAA